jgi:hypothetical protein
MVLMPPLFTELLKVRPDESGPGIVDVPRAAIEL